MHTLYVGVDVSQEHLDVAIATTPTLRKALGRLCNDQAGWEELAAQVSQVADFSNSF